MAAYGQPMGLFQRDLVLTWPQAAALYSEYCKQLAIVMERAIASGETPDEALETAVAFMDEFYYSQGRKSAKFHSLVELWMDNHMSCVKKKMLGQLTAHFVAGGTADDFRSVPGQAVLDCTPGARTGPLPS
jgi:hypothetical protein